MPALTGKPLKRWKSFAPLLYEKKNAPSIATRMIFVS